jgi:hypothetical protein
MPEDKNEAATLGIASLPAQVIDRLLIWPAAPLHAGLLTDLGIRPSLLRLAGEGRKEASGNPSLFRPSSASIRATPGNNRHCTGAVSTRSPYGVVEQFRVFQVGANRLLRGRARQNLGRHRTTGSGTTKSQAMERYYAFGRNRTERQYRGSSR